VAVVFIAWCRPIGTAAGLTRIVLIAPPTAFGTDIAVLDTTWGTPPFGWVSSSVARSAASARATLPDAEITNGSRCVTTRPDRVSQALTARCWAAVAPYAARTCAGVR
jgi:hypothetical protein